MKKRITLKDAIARIAELEREVRELKARPAQEVHHYHYPPFTIPAPIAPAPFEWPAKIWRGNSACPSIAN